MRRFRVSISTLAFAGALLVGVPSNAQEWRAGWQPVNDGLGNGWGAARPFWWGELGPTPYWGGTSWDWALGWPYNTWYGPASTYAYRVEPATPYYAESPAPFVSARSVATASFGMHCSTPVKTCLLTQASYIGGGCSCKVTGHSARGSVVP